MPIDKTPQPSAPTYAGPHAKLVNEVISFWLGPEPFTPGKRPTAREALVLTDVSRAVSVNRETTFAVDPDEPGEEDLEYTWGDLLENLGAELIYTTEWYAWEKKHEAALKNLRQPFRQTWRDRVKDLLAEEFAAHVFEEVSDVLCRCAENRAFNGRTDNFWEQLFQLYHRGVWPCGWKGRWPAPGRFIVWRPTRSVKKKGPTTSKQRRGRSRRS